MVNYILRRVLLAVPTLLVVSMVLFTMLHMAPGGPMAVYASNPNVDQAELMRIEERLGLNDPIPVQYRKWLTGMLTGQWGISYKFGRDVAGILSERIWASLQLVLTSLIIAVIVAVPFGVFSAVNRNRILQYVSNAVAMLGVSIPTFWLGLVILLVFSVRLRLIPTGGMAPVGEPAGLWVRLTHLLPPAAVLATLHLAAWSRYVRSSMLEVISEDYIRTARSKGLPERVVVYKHALRNALLPLITLLGLQGGNLIGGAMVTEVVFAWPGVGRLLTESLGGRDYPVLMASFMIMSVLAIGGNLVADVCYSFADPRIRLE